VVAHYDVIWRKIAHLNVSLFVQMLLYNKIPTKDNLTRHKMTHLNSSSCEEGCGENENSNHFGYQI
jgi:hypothetical protein